MAASNTSSILGSTLLLPQLAATKDERNRSAWIDWCKPESVECRECRTALAFAYWHGGRNDHVYGTGRAALILAEADALGYVISER